MEFLESKITTDFVKFGHYLGLSMNELWKIEESVGHDPKRCIKQILFLWRSSQDLSHKAIAAALEASGYQLLSKIVGSHSTSSTYCSMCQKTHGEGFNTLRSFNYLSCFDHYCEYINCPYIILVE